MFRAGPRQVLRRISCNQKRSGKEGFFFFLSVGRQSCRFEELGRGAICSTFSVAIEFCALDRGFGKMSNCRDGTRPGPPEGQTSLGRVWQCGFFSWEAYCSAVSGAWAVVVLYLTQLWGPGTPTHPSHPYPLTVGTELMVPQKASKHLLTQPPLPPS